MVFGKEQHPFWRRMGIKQQRRTAMEPYQQRVVREKEELDAKIENLVAFIASDRFFDTVTDEEQKRLRRQEVLMELYSEVLAERIAAFK